MNTDNQKGVRYFVIILVAAAILGAPRTLTGVFPHGAAALIVSTVAAFAVIPVVRKIWPVPGEKPFSPKLWLLWSLFLVVLVLGLIAIEAPPLFLSSWFQAHPGLAKIDSIAGGWLLPGAVLLICAGMMLLRSNTNDGKS